MIRPEATFCSLPHLALADLGQSGAEVAIFGASHGTPYQPGTASHAAAGPAALRAALEWYDTRRAHIDMDTGRPLLGAVNAVDVGDVPGDPKDDGKANRAAIREAAAAIRAAGAVPILLGGDDSVPIPFFEGFAGDRIWVVQVDAHLDWPRLLGNGLCGGRLGLRTEWCTGQHRE